MGRPAPADFDPPNPVGDSNRPSSRNDEGKAPFAYDRRLAGHAPSNPHSKTSDRDAISSFRSEKRFSAGRALLIVGLAVLAVAGLATAVTLWARTRTHANSLPPVVTQTGTATINSRPDGAQVSIDGQPRGITPLKVSLPAGPHTLELTNGGETRTIPLQIESGTIVSQYIDLIPTGVGSSESLQVSSDPPGAQVVVDGKPRGVTPLTVAAIGIGDHEVVISSGDAKVKRTVNVAKGATASVVATLAPAGSSAGWLSIKSPIELQIQENGKLVGTTSADQIMLPAGSHSLELVNAALAFRTGITVQIAPGKTATPAVSLPNGLVSMNAVPWAEVWLDGKSLGTTPLANIAVPIGTHELVFRHPQLGERRQTLTVTTRTPVRVGVEFNK
jgi:hypothetical protein